MSIENDLATLFSAQASITGAVSGKTTGVYAAAAPQRDASNDIVKPPLIIVTLLNSDFYNTIEATGGVATGIRLGVLDIDCKGWTNAEASTVEAAVAAYFDDFSGTAGSSTIESVHLTDSGGDVETPEHGEGVPVFVKTLEAEVIYS